MAGFNMDDYITVPERIVLFNAAFPEGSLQSEIVELTSERVTVKAYAYRKPDDPRPGVGHSSLEIPGKTSFTKGSEIENAETSAWGRAIAALGFEVKRGIASKEEVANKQPQDGERGKALGGNTPATTRPAVSPNTYRRGELVELMRENGLDTDAIEAIALAVDIPRKERPMSDASMDTLIDAIRDSVAIEPAAVTAVEAGPEGAGTPSSGPSPRTVEEAIADAEKRAGKAEVTA